MAHPNRLYNGDISRDLTNWDVAGGAVYVASEGNLELGAAYLANSGDSISQEFTIGIGRSYMIELATKAAGVGLLALTITNQDGNTVYTTNIDVKTSWSLYAERVGLPWGTFTLTLAYNDTAVYIDDISLAWVVATRAELATTVHNRLGVLATNANVVLLPVISGSGGFYADPIDIALRTVGACDPAGRPDVRYLTEDNLDACINEIELAALHQLHRYWSTKTDYAIGPRSENRSQVGAAIDRLIGTAVGGRAAAAGRGVQQRRLIHRSTHP